ncbi:helix-turn-helix domain-containing protein [Synechococcus sp. PCC 7335]
MPRIAPSRIEAICRVLGCTPGELIEIKDDPIG